MLGVHGNGLTHLIWMPPTPRSTVIELFFKGGFARDCKSRNLPAGNGTEFMLHDEPRYTNNER